VTLNTFRTTARKKSFNEKTATASVLESLSSFEEAQSTWDIDYARMLVSQTMEGMQSDFAPATWNALKLVFSDGTPVDQAAAQTGVSPWTIYSAKARLLKRLREQLDGLL